MMIGRVSMLENRPVLLLMIRKTKTAHVLESFVRNVMDGESGGEESGFTARTMQSGK